MSETNKADVPTLVERVHSLVNEKADAGFFLAIAQHITEGNRLLATKMVRDWLNSADFQSDGVDRNLLAAKQWVDYYYGPMSDRVSRMSWAEGNLESARGSNESLQNEINHLRLKLKEVVDNADRARRVSREKGFEHDAEIYELRERLSRTRNALVCALKGKHTGETVDILLGLDF